MRYFIVISPAEVECKTVVHGCHCPGDIALHKCKALAIIHVAQRCVVLPSFIKPQVLLGYTQIPKSPAVQGVTLKKSQTSVLKKLQTFYASRSLQSPSIKVAFSKQTVSYCKISYP